MMSDSFPSRADPTGSPTVLTGQPARRPPPLVYPTGCARSTPPCWMTNGCSGLLHSDRAPEDGQRPCWC